MEPPADVVALAMEQSALSPCRSKRGAVIFRVGPGGVAVESSGYNYKPNHGCDGTAACKATCRDLAIHAEQQALLHSGALAAGADLLHVKSVDGQLVTSGGPSCVQCSKFALVCGIAGVWLYHDSGWRRYRMDEFHAASLASSVPPPARAVVVAEALVDEMSILVESLVASSESAAQNPDVSQPQDVADLLQRYASHADRLLKKLVLLASTPPDPAPQPEKCLVCGSLYHSPEGCDVRAALAPEPAPPALMTDMRQIVVDALDDALGAGKISDVQLVAILRALPPSRPQGTAPQEPKS